MKLRITNRSIRLRLSQSDVQRFSESGSVEEVLRFGAGPDDAFSYRLVRSGNVSRLSANIENRQLTVSMTEEEAAAWTTSEMVGVEGSQPTVEGSNISILIEKDFACLTPRAGDDDKDTYPHPAAKSNC
jgi:hypothetical protein